METIRSALPRIANTLRRRVCGVLQTRRSQKTAEWIFIAFALTIVIGFYRLVLGPTICDMAGRPASCASPEKTMKTFPALHTNAPDLSRIMPHQLQVRLRVIPEQQQRYDTSGDWLWNGDHLEIRISREIADQDPRYAMLLFVHEMIEAILCRAAGISAAQVDAFDMSHPQSSEPGADLAAPYHHQHMAAEAAERALADQLGVNWQKYVSD